MVETRSISRKRKRVMKPTRYMPTDVLHNILLRLSTASVQRLQSVSKQWSQAIAERHFTDAHIAAQPWDDFCLIFCYRDYNTTILANRRRRSRTSAPPGAEMDTQANKKMKGRRSSITQHYKLPAHGTHVFDSYNGLLLLDYAGKRNNQKIALNVANPMREYITRLRELYGNHMVLDPATGDLKVDLIAQPVDNQKIAFQVASPMREYITKLRELYGTSQGSVCFDRAHIVLDPSVALHVFYPMQKHIDHEIRSVNIVLDPVSGDMKVDFVGHPVDPTEKKIITLHVVNPPMREYITTLCHFCQYRDSSCFDNANMVIDPATGDLKVEYVGKPVDNQKKIALHVANPMTGQITRLPHFHGYGGNLNSANIVLDPSTGDLKVVVVGQPIAGNRGYGGLGPLTCGVLTLQGSSSCSRWREVQHFPRELYMDSRLYPPTYANGALYWRTSTQVIVSLDLAQEKFHQIDVTSFLPSSELRNLGFFLVWDGRLAALQKCDRPACYRIWILTDSAEWTKQHPDFNIALFKRLCPSENFSDDDCPPFPVASLRDGKVIIFRREDANDSNNNFIAYHVRRQSMTPLTMEVLHGRSMKSQYRFLGDRTKLPFIAHVNSVVSC